MDLQILLILGTVFLFSASLVGLVFLIWTESKFAEKRTVKKRLLYISAGGRHGQDVLENYKKMILDDTSMIEKLAFSMPRIKELDRLLLNAGVPLNTSTFLLVCLTLGLGGAVLGVLFLPRVSMGVFLGLVLFLLPFVLLKLLESRNMAAFEEQLPEALDLLGRAVRSGHALTSAMAMVADEMQPPISSEFSATVDEINLGLSLKDALDNMTERVPSQDLRFFAIAVIIQKETGGNIAEIFDNISRLIRERHQFRRQVRALTAEGRLSGWVLVLLPFFVFGYIYVVNYDYISLLWMTKMGIYMMVGAIVLMVLGILAIKKIVSIEI